MFPEIILSNLWTMNTAQKASAMALMNYRGAPTAEGAMNKSLAAGIEAGGDGVKRKGRVLLQNL